MKDQYTGPIKHDYPKENALLIKKYKSLQKELEAVKVEKGKLEKRIEASMEFCIGRINYHADNESEPKVVLAEWNVCMTKLLKGGEEYADCPFCGSRPQRMIEGELGHENVWVQCTSCMATAEEDVWDKRPIHESLQKKIFQYKTILGSLEQNYPETMQEFKEGCERGMIELLKGANNEGIKKEGG